MTDIEELENKLHTAKNDLNINIGLTIIFTIVFAVAVYYTVFPPFPLSFMMTLPFVFGMLIAMILFGVEGVSEYQYEAKTIKVQLATFKTPEGISVDEYNKVNGEN
jgi:hypothetical protein